MTSMSPRATTARQSSLVSAMPNDLAMVAACSWSGSHSTATSLRGSRCQPGMCAIWAQRPAPSTATLSLLFFIFAISCVVGAGAPALKQVFQGVGDVQLHHPGRLVGLARLDQNTKWDVRIGDIDQIGIAVMAHRERAPHVELDRRPDLDQKAVARQVEKEFVDLKIKPDHLVGVAAAGGSLNVADKL